MPLVLVATTPYTLLLELLIQVISTVVEVNDMTQGYQAYKIAVTKDVFGGEDQGIGPNSRVGQFVYVPYRVSFMEYPGRVMNLG